jgi:hypothetical protein
MWLCRYVQHWDLTDAVIVVQQADGEEEPSCGLCPTDAESAKESIPDRTLSAAANGAGCAISSILTDGDGADSHLSSHMTSAVTAAPYGSLLTANTESSRFTANVATSSLLHPLAPAGPVGVGAGLAGSAHPEITAALADAVAAAADACGCGASGSQQSVGCRGCAAVISG